MTAVSERRWDDRRAGRTAFRYPERRTGFDRRSGPGLIASYRDQPQLIAVVLLSVLLLNAIDLLLTLRLLASGAVEVNPVMARLLEIDPALAASFKLLAMVGVVTVIWNMRIYRRILQVSLAALIGFGSLVTYQGILLVTIT